MKKLKVKSAVFFAVIFICCYSEKSKTDLTVENINQFELQSDTLTKRIKPFKAELPTTGLLIFNGILQGEVIATSDVFGKPNNNPEQIFNIITISENRKAITTEEGMHFVPDYTFEDCPKLTALFVPSGCDIYNHINNEKMMEFIKSENEETKYVVSNYGGVQLIGKSGIADGHKIVTYIVGGKEPQEQYPNLKVQNDSLITFVEDGKFSSPNGNLTGYISALNLLERMTSLEHRQFVEQYLYLDWLQNWKINDCDQNWSFGT